MRVVLEREAEQEMLESAAYYEAQQAGLGAAFLDAVDEAADQIGRQPRLWGYYSRPVRSIRLKRFPYRLLYVVQPERVYVVAVMHLHRQPGYWRRRLP
jgi:plasmid stabilization system protein ParE